MIYEFRSYILKPATVPDFLKRFEEGYEHRKQHSEVLGVWYTEIGPLNQVVHVWPYENMAERARIRAESAKSPHWPPKVHEYLLTMESEIFVPFPFSPPPKPGEYGPYYEFRSYIAQPAGGMAGVIENTEPMLPGRLGLSPMLFMGQSDLGSLNKLVHIWPYKSLDERMEIRKKAVDENIWPPAGARENLMTQENKIMLPASFSPMQ